MKQLMKIMGAELIHQTSPEDGIMELTLVPCETVTKKKPGLMEMARGGFESMMEEAINAQPRKTKTHVNLIDWLKEFKNQPLSNVWMEITLDQSAEQISKGER